MACRLVGAKPLPEPMLTYCQLDPWEQTSVKNCHKTWTYNGAIKVNTPEGVLHTETTSSQLRQLVPDADPRLFLWTLLSVNGNSYSLIAPFIWWTVLVNKWLLLMNWIIQCQRQEKEKYLQIQRTCYLYGHFRCYRSFIPMKLHLLSAVLFGGFRGSPGALKALSGAVPGEFHRSGKHSKHNCLQDRATFHRSKGFGVRDYLNLWHCNITLTIYTMYIFFQPALSFCRSHLSFGDSCIMCIGDNRSDRNYADAHDTYIIKAGTTITMTMKFQLCKAWFTICNSSSVVLITSVPWYPWHCYPQCRNIIFWFPY